MTAPIRPVNPGCNACRGPYHDDTTPVVELVRTSEGRRLVRVDLGQSCAGAAYFTKVKADALARELLRLCEYVPGESSATEHVPIPMLLWCPDCGARHVDEGEWSKRVHHTHACQDCGMAWRPAAVPTVGVRFLPGFKNQDVLEEIGSTLDRFNDSMSQIAGATAPPGGFR